MIRVPWACSVAASTAVVSVLGHKWSQLIGPRHLRLAPRRAFASRIVYLVGRLPVQRGRAAAGSAGAESSTDPQLIDEHRPVGVELVVADTPGKQHQGAWVVDRHPRSLTHDLVVDACPERPGRAGIVGLERESLGDLGVDPVVAELGGVDVAQVVREEGLAGQQRADEV